MKLQAALQKRAQPHLRITLRLPHTPPANTHACRRPVDHRFHPNSPPRTGGTAPIDVEQVRQSDFRSPIADIRIVSGSHPSSIGIECISVLYLWYQHSKQKTTRQVSCDVNLRCRCSPLKKTKHSAHAWLSALAAWVVFGTSETK